MSFMPPSGPTMVTYPASFICLGALLEDSVQRSRIDPRRLEECFSRLTSITNFSLPRDCENFFRASDFKNGRSVTTPYGKIKVCAITYRLRRELLHRSSSLHQQCVLALNELGPPQFTVDLVLALPANTFRLFVATAFQVYWLPMSHVRFHGCANNINGIPYNLQRVFQFITSLRVFERMFDECRDVLVFIFCWLQHTHFYSLRHEELSATRPQSWNPDSRPLVKPHQLSDTLLQTYKQLLQELIQTDGSSSRYEKSNNMVSHLFLGLKIARFLCEISEYVYSIHAAGLTKDHLHLIPDDRVRRWLDYETGCIILRCMNSDTMYAKHKDRFVFEHYAPSLLKSLHQCDQIPFRPDPRRPSSYHILPTKIACAITDHEKIKHVALGSQLGPSGDVPSALAFDAHEIQDVFSHANQINPTFMYAQLVNYHYAMSSYEEAFQFSLLANNHIRICLQEHLPLSVHVVIEVLRLLCKMCTIKREYNLSFRIIKCALQFSRCYLGTSNSAYVNLLLEYGSLLINTDRTSKAAYIYTLALAHVIDFIPGPSILSALVLEAIAYAHYVLEYTTGAFNHAHRCASIGSLLLGRLDHGNCMQAASVNRVKALIMEEIAIDSNNKESLTLAEELHKQSLDRCEQTYGHLNIQTAKHYGNLGRLYQSMQKYKEAEECHLTAIGIKTKLLGELDFEVGLSKGHLASLYNYDMGRFEEAEKLYLESIKINMEAFGPTYSGLEYDYRGLQRVYFQKGDTFQENQYVGVLREWQNARNRMSRMSDNSDTIDVFELTKAISSRNQLWTDFSQLLTEYEEKLSHCFSGFVSPTLTTDHKCGKMTTKKLPHTSESSRSAGY